MKSGYLYIDNNIFSTLLAISETEQAKGLMEVVDPVPVMSFLYKNSKVNKFWMANTPSKLDIVFCLNGKVSEICVGNPYELKSIGSNNFSDLVIELPYGTVELKNIQIGQKVGFLAETKSQLKKLNFKNYV